MAVRLIVGSRQLAVGNRGYFVDVDYTSIIIQRSRQASSYVFYLAYCPLSTAYCL